MKLRKTDRRFKLYKFGFDCFVEFDMIDGGYNEYMRYCHNSKNILGEQFTYFHGKVYTAGNYHIVGRHRVKNSYKKRIYFRGEKYHTLLLMSMPAKDENTFYL